MKKGYLTTVTIAVVIILALSFFGIFEFSIFVNPTEKPASWSLTKQVGAEQSPSWNYGQNIGTLDNSATNIGTYTISGWNIVLAQYYVMAGSEGKKVDDFSLNANGYIYYANEGEQQTCAGFCANTYTPIIAGTISQNDKLKITNEGSEETGTVTLTFTSYAPQFMDILYTVPDEVSEGENKNIDIKIRNNYLNNLKGRIKIKFFFKTPFGITSSSQSVTEEKILALGDNSITQFKIPTDTPGELNYEICSDIHWTDYYTRVSYQCDPGCFAFCQTCYKYLGPHAAIGSLGCKVGSIPIYSSLLKEKIVEIGILQGTLQEKIAYIQQVEANIQEQVELIELLTSKRDEQGQIINELELTISNQAKIIEQLTKNANEQGQIINELELNIQQKAQLIESLTTEINKQAEIINSLKLNLNQKAELINQMDLTVQQDAALISQLKLSLSEQGTLIDNMDLTVAEDIQLIKQMDLKISEQAELISQLNLQVEEYSKLIKELNLNTDEQAQIISKLQLTLTDEEKLIGLLNLTTEEKQMLQEKVEYYQKWNVVFELWWLWLGLIIFVIYYIIK